MAYKNALSAYRETRIKTAGQGQLIIMLYDAAIKQLDSALECLHPAAGQKRDPAKIEKTGKSVLKTQEIITELMVSLDMDAGGEIAANLFSLYTWFNHELLEASITQDAARIATVRGMLADLRGTWHQAIAQTAAVSNRDGFAGVRLAG
ncbi:MAG: flagellar export chaperone FliS [Spirochaetaceae bacterium]|nr:flagellar export chaperone FliS [Spirochaetaceae bacterium]